MEQRIEGARLYLLLSASPTCFLSEISRKARDFKFICRKRSANPWDENGAEKPDVPLMTADCYCRGSEELDNLLRWRYTSVPYLSHVSELLFYFEGERTYPSMLINFKSPPKYLAYNLEIGNPYPNPAIGALKSLLSKSGSKLGVVSTVVYM